MNKKLWHNQYIVYVVTSIITIVVGIIFRDGIFNALSWIWNNTFNIFINIRVWWIILSASLIFLFLRAYKNHSKKAYLKYKTEKIELPPWAETISDDIKAIVMDNIRRKYLDK